MRYKVLKYDLVDVEIESVVLYYESISYDLGFKFESEVEKALDKLETSPIYILYLLIEYIEEYLLKGFRMFLSKTLRNFGFNLLF